MKGSSTKGRPGRTGSMSSMWSAPLGATTNRDSGSPRARQLAALNRDTVSTAAARARDRAVEEPVPRPERPAVALGHPEDARVVHRHDLPPGEHRRRTAEAEQELVAGGPRQGDLLEGDAPPTGPRDRAGPLGPRPGPARPRAVAGRSARGRGPRAGLRPPSHTAGSRDRLAQPLAVDRDSARRRPGPAPSATPCVQPFMVEALSWCGALPSTVCTRTVRRRGQRDRWEDDGTAQAACRDARSRRPGSCRHRFGVRRTPHHRTVVRGRGAPRPTGRSGRRPHPAVTTAPAAPVTSDHRAGRRTHEHPRCAADRRHRARSTAPSPGAPPSGRAARAARRSRSPPTAARPGGNRTSPAAITSPGDRRDQGFVVGADEACAMGVRSTTDGATTWPGPARSPTPPATRPTRPRSGRPATAPSRRAARPRSSTWPATRPTAPRPSAPTGRSGRPATTAAPGPRPAG